MLYCFSFCKNNGCRCTSIQDYVGKYPHTIKCTELEKLTISTKTCINIRKLQPPPPPSPAAPHKQKNMFLHYIPLPPHTKELVPRLEPPPPFPY